MRAPLPTYRAANYSDANRIADFQIMMAWETEKIRLDPLTCRSGVQAVFARPTLGTYHVCARETGIVGSLLITPEWSDWRNGLIWWIQSVYIEPEFRRQGYFTCRHRNSEVLSNSRKLMVLNWPLSNWGQNGTTIP
jgi:hypothetical protein